jgi:hypothetical protein
MNKIVKKLSKSKLIELANSSLDEELSPKKSNLNISKSDAIIDAQNMDIRDKGDWETDISESYPAKKCKKRVGMFTKLPNGLTPQEIMYGKVENDSNYFNKEPE